jgi:hypothetical protein
MRITKYEKEAIIRAIMHDIPSTPESVLKAEIKKAFINGMSAPVQELHKTHPHALRTSGVSGCDSGLGYRIDFIVGDADVAEVLKPFVARKGELDSVRARLSGVVNSCNTLAQLKKLLPEFVSYFPTEAEPTKNLPAVANMVADLSKLGWPKKVEKKS